MLQVELRVNGQLIDYIDIINRATLVEGDFKCRYEIRHQGKSYECIHKRSDGALVLVKKAINKIKS